MSCAKTTTVAFTATPDAGLQLSAVASAQDNLIVIDWISLKGTAGATDETWELSVVNSSADNTSIFDISQTVTASTDDNMFLQFPSGLPLYQMGAAGSLPVVATAPLILTTTITSSQLYVGYHLESRAMRPVNH